MKKSPCGVLKIIMSNLSRLRVDFFSLLDVYNVSGHFFFGNLSVPDVLIRYRTFIYFDIMSHLDIYWERTLIRYSRVCNTFFEKNRILRYPLGFYKE